MICCYSTTPLPQHWDMSNVKHKKVTKSTKTHSPCIQTLKLTFLYSEWIEQWLITETVGEQKLRMQRQDASIHRKCANREAASHYTYNWSIMHPPQTYILSRRWVVSLYPPYPHPPTEACCSDNCSPKLMTSPGALVSVTVCVWTIGRDASPLQWKSSSFTWT